LFINFKGNILPHTAVSLPAVSAAALYGRGIFTTIAIYCGKPFLWNLHEKRLRQNALKVGIELSDMSFGDVQNSLLELIEHNKINNGRARITLFDSRSSRLWQFESKSETCVLITPAKSPVKPKDNLKLTISPFRVNSASPLTGVKSCNYLENILSLEMVNKQNFDEAVRFNEHSQVVSAIMANLFWVKGETIFTPGLPAGALEGTTRGFVMGLLKELGFVVKETTALLKDLKTADEIFLTSAGLGICLVESLDSQNLSDKISAKIQMAFSEIINA
jgi:4-amino-4-deoxychorismate lyase